MFQRIVVDEWVHWMPVLAFIIFFLVFLWVSWRAVRMKKPERRRLAALPLDVDNLPS